MRIRPLRAARSATPTGRITAESPNVNSRAFIALPSNCGRSGRSDAVDQQADQRGLGGDVHTALRDRERPVGVARVLGHVAPEPFGRLERERGLLVREFDLARDESIELTVVDVDLRRQTVLKGTR